VPRPLRQEQEGGVFHVYARGNNRRAIFTDGVDRQRYLGLLARSVRHHRLLLLSYCLMPNHVHLLVETPETNLATAVQRVHGPYAQAFNRRHGCVGHLFGGRYGCVPITSDAQLLIAARYIALNPVAASLVSDPGDWPWSSHRALTGIEEVPSWLSAGRLMEHFSGWSPEPLRAYAALVST
jgi:REP element-mobilizing transposase RayT